MILPSVSYLDLLLYAVKQTQNPEALAAGILVGLCEDYPDELSGLACVLPPDVVAGALAEGADEPPRLKFVPAEPVKPQRKQRPDGTAG